MQKNFLILVSALCIVMLVTGCTTQAPSLPHITSQQNISDQKNATEPGIEQTQQTPHTPSHNPSSQYNRIQNQTPPTTTPTAEPSLRPDPDPYVSNLGFTGYYFSFDIPGCDMREIFPEYAKDTDYGIEQPVPKLSTVSADVMRTFIRDHTMAGTQNSRFKGIYGCQGVSMTPDWNFAEFRATVTPRNARPATYDISLIMKSRGRNITVYTTRETLTADRQIGFVRYIPMKADEMELLDIPYVMFTRVPEPALTTTPRPRPPGHPLHSRRLLTLLCWCSGHSQTSSIPSGTRKTGPLKKMLLNTSRS